MAKAKVKRKPARLSKDNAVKLNPFEVRINKKKHQTLGQKTEKNERGFPGVSRSRAIQKRRNTLLKEYKNRHKTKNLLDRRFGERDEMLTEEERMIQRQIKLTENMHRKKSVFNLEDEEDLTHYGQSIGTMETFDDLQLSSDDNNSEVDDTETHFGGFLKRKLVQTPSGESSGTEVVAKTRKQAIEDLVAKSKQHKFERQKEKEKVDELLESIDNQWSDVRSLMTKKTSNSKDTTEPSTDDFDRYLKELETEPRPAQAGERMKSLEEKKQLEQEELKILEKERQNRMSIRHSDMTSADQDVLNNGGKMTDKRVMIQYDDNGRIKLPSGITSLKEHSEIGSEDDMDEDICDDGDNSSDDSESVEDGDDSEPGDVYSEGSDIDQQLDDYHCEDGEEDSGDYATIPNKGNDVKRTTDFTELLNKCSSPSQYRDLLDQLTTQATSNTKQAESLFRCVLKQCLVLAESLDAVTMETINALVKSLFRLCKISPAHSANVVQNRLRRSLKHFQKSFKGTCQDYPTNSDIILFKVVEVLYPMSDFRHPVATPTIQLMASIISRHHSVNTVDNIIRNLFICQILIKGLTLSKRYVPELINYLTGLITLYVTDKEEKDNHTVFGNDLQTCLSQLLDNGDIWKKERTLSLLELISEPRPSLDNVVIRSLLVVSLKQVQQLSELWQALHMADVIFGPVLSSLKKLLIPDHSIELMKSTIVRDIEEKCCNKPKPVLQLLRQKPKSIKFFEPSIDMDYQPGRKRFAHKSTGEKFKLKHKHKRELKGAIREIRKDNKFLAKERLKEQLEKDAIRRRKVNQITGWLQQEKGETKSQRMHRRKK